MTAPLRPPRALPARALSARALPVLGLLALAACQGPGISPTRDTANHLTVGLGQRRFQGSEWGAADDQPVLVIEHGGRTPYGFEYEVGVAGSDGDGTGPTSSQDGNSTEVWAGLRNTLGRRGDPVRFFLSGGISGIHARVRDTPLSGAGPLTTSETDFGAYLRLGGYVPLGARLRLGLEYRWGYDLFGPGDLDTEYHQGLFTVGYGF